ncbi:uncharacterized protein LOC143452609 [Clavelina lepadiformis]|uniref:uncharacterized protein LOC143452609 n=1 Tax=Clavelina lepadiformis TaxID=159417 RepID=UPI00404192B8
MLGSHHNIRGNTFCYEVLAHVGPLVEYIYLGSLEKVLGEKSKCGKFQKFSTSEVSNIVNSKGSNFQLRDEEYRCVKIESGLYIYDGPSRPLICAMGPNFILLVLGSVCADRSIATDDCLKAIQYGQKRLNGMKT